MPTTPIGLSTIENLKAIAGVSGTSQDTALTLLLRTSSAQIESYCSRRFGLRTVTETLAGTGRTELLVSTWPIVSVTSVTVDGAAVTDYSLRNSAIPDGPYYLWRWYGWRWKPSTIADLTGDPDAQSSDHNVAIEYVAGYKLPGVTYNYSNTILNAAMDLPADIEMAALRQAQYLFTRRPGLTGERTPGGYSYEAATPNGESFLEQDIRALLEPYVRRY